MKLSLCTTYDEQHTHIRCSNLQSQLSREIWHKVFCKSFQEFSIKCKQFFWTFSEAPFLQFLSSFKFLLSPETTKNQLTSALWDISRAGHLLASNHWKGKMNAFKRSQEKKYDSLQISESNSFFFLRVHCYKTQFHTLTNQGLYQNLRKILFSWSSAEILYRKVFSAISALCGSGQDLKLDSRGYCLYFINSLGWKWQKTSRLQQKSY